MLPTCNPSTWQVEVGSRVQRNPQLYNEVKISMSYLRWERWFIGTYCPSEETQVGSLALTRCLTAACNSSPRGPHAIFRPLGALHTYTDTQKSNKLSLGDEGLTSQHTEGRGISVGSRPAWPTEFLRQSYTEPVSSELGRVMPVRSECRRLRQGDFHSVLRQSYLAKLFSKDRNNLNSILQSLHF